MKPHPWLDRALMYCSSHYTLCLTEDAFKRVLRHLSVTPEETPPFVLNWHSNATTHHFEHRDDNKKSAVICVRGWEDKTGVQIACLLVHEAVHIWQEHCLDIGEHKPGAEQEAYAIQNIAQALMESYAEAAMGFPIGWTDLNHSETP